MVCVSTIEDTDLGKSYHTNEIYRYTAVSAILSPAESRILLLQVIATTGGRGDRVSVGWRVMQQGMQFSRLDLTSNSAHLTFQSNGHTINKEGI
jgi:hypothetical protein